MSDDDDVWRWLRVEPAGAWELHAAGVQLERAGKLEMAATAFDRAFGAEPGSPTIRDARQRVLDRLARVEFGIAFRYVPAGVFVMGSEAGDADERPVHAVDLDAFWIAETPVTWALYCKVLGWENPLSDSAREDRKLRLQYCETSTTRALDWHSHAPAGSYDARGHGVNRPLDFSVKPMIAVGSLDADGVAALLDCRLPAEAEWEKAARGGLVQRRYAWGDEPPDLTRCDSGRMGEVSILPPKSFPPNGYGLYAMCGTVWEWTASRYDALGYAPGAPPPPDGAERVLRGGSWTDGPEAVTVSFRMSRPETGHATRAARHAANIGFRVCLQVRADRPRSA
jgi:sulfatase modifying factor 1